MKPQRTSVIVATLDEAANIDHVIDTALSDEAVVEVIIADGGSNDTTVEKIQARAVADQRIRLVANPYRGQAAGLNMAAFLAVGELLIRLDGHTRYATDYVSASIEAWEPGVAVGGPMLAEGSGPVSIATAQAMSDPLAIGPARFHHADGVENADTVYLGTFARDRFLRLGGYRTFPSGTVEDTDFYARWRRDGGTVRVDPAIRSWYQPRDTWRHLAKQYFRYGRGKAELVWLNGRFPSLRPLAPSLLVAGIGISVIVGIVSTWIPLAAIVSAWLGALAIVGTRARTRHIRTATVAATMHAAYGVGLWWGLLSGRPSVEALGLGVEPGSPDDASTMR
jgi:glycosyltransferase involved in cell wall biosynthesis